MRAFQSVSSLAGRATVRFQPLEFECISDIRSAGDIAQKHKQTVSILVAFQKQNNSLDVMKPKTPYPHLKISLGKFGLQLKNSSVEISCFISQSFVMFDMYEI
jgi:hypothetical protein